MTSVDPASVLAGASALLSAVLRARGAEVDALARTLAPDGPGPGVRFHVYRSAEALLSPAEVVAYQARFARVEELFALLDAGDPGALVLAVELVARLAPEVAVSVAERLLPLPAPMANWNALGQALGRALGRCSSEQSFRLLVDHPDVPYLRDGLGTNGYAGGVIEAWALARSVDLLAPALDPRVRVRVLPAVAYLAQHDAQAAFALLVQMLDASHEVEVFAAHALSRIAPEGVAVLRARLERAPLGVPLRFAAEVALRLACEESASTVVDVLGGEARLASPEGRPRLRALIACLARDAWRRPSEGGPRGWLAADPRVAALLAGLKGDADRELAASARDLLATLPKEPRPRAETSNGKKAATVARGAVASDASIERELHEVRARLERLVRHLRGVGYRFAAPRRVLVPPRALDTKALARLEKKVPVPAALSAFWRIVGSVDLRGQDPAWGVTACLLVPESREPVWQTDPLVIAPAAEVIAEALDTHESEPFGLRLAPDAMGKAGYSGGALTVWLPQGESDPVIEHAGIDGGSESLMAHVRRALDAGGLPGLAESGAAPAWIAAAREACRVE